MFKYKIKVILKSGHEIRVRAKHYTIYYVGLIKIQFEHFNLKEHAIDNAEIAAIIVKHWYQRWE